jgi:hypothetical protein
MTSRTAKRAYLHISLPFSLGLDFGAVAGSVPLLSAMLTLQRLPRYPMGFFEHLPNDLLPSLIYIDVGMFDSVFPFRRYTLTNDYRFILHRLLIQIRTINIEFL